MQIILVSRHLKAARTITIMPRHVLAVLAMSFVLLFSTSALFSWLSVHWRLPVVENLLLSLQQQETEKTENHVSNNLQLDGLSERLSELAGRKPEAVLVAKGGQGGPFLPAPMAAEVLQREIDRLAAAVDQKTGELVLLESRLLEKRVKDRLLPTVLPVKEAVFGSAFGYRNDPIVGGRAMHEGLDFSAEMGAPVVVAADGVVLSVDSHPEYGHVIDVDHGDGLTSRYAHLSRTDVKAGVLVKRGEKIGGVGTSGRSTGPHLHFEVRMSGVAQNPAVFLRRGTEFAQLKRR